jgi:hypothetical protein
VDEREAAGEHCGIAAVVDGLGWVIKRWLSFRHRELVFESYVLDGMIWM